MVSNHISVFLLLLPQILQSTLAQDFNFGSLSTFETIAEGYELSFETTDDSVTFRAIVATTGYVGFGISPSGNMNGADIFIAGVTDSTQEPYFGDYYSSSSTTPTRDTVQNWNLTDATQNATHTALTFSRSFDTGDDAQDLVIEEGEITVIWSVGSTDTINYHATRRGHAHLTIREGDGDGYTTTTEVWPTDSPYECTSTKPCPTGMFCDYNIYDQKSLESRSRVANAGGYCRCIDGVYSYPQYDSEFRKSCARIAGASCILNPVDIDFIPCLARTSCIARNATHGRCQCQVGFVRTELGFCEADYGTPCGSDGTRCSKKLFLDCRNERCVCASPTLEYEFGSGKGCVAPAGEPCNIGISTESANRVQCAQGLECVEARPAGSGDYFCQELEDPPTHQ